MPTYLLPPGLLDLTISRAAARLNISTVQVGRRAFHACSTARSMHQAALAAAPPPAYNGAVAQSFSRDRRGKKKDHGSGALSVRREDHLSELERRVQALQHTVVAEIDTPRLSENELLALYEDLLAFPQPEVSPHVSPEKALLSEEETDRSAVDAVNLRLCELDAPSPAIEREHVGTSLASRLNKRHSEYPSAYTPPEKEPISLQSPDLTAKPYHRVINRLEELIRRMEAVRATVNGNNSEEVGSVPVRFVSDAEWASLTRVCMQEQDYKAAETSLQLMKRSGVVPPEESVDLVFAEYAKRGWVENFEQFMLKVLTAPPTPYERDLHVKAHLNASPVNGFPTCALALLHTYESQSLPAPIRSYTRVITTLFSLHTARGAAHAWDLFAHMRYAAHPTPDSLLVALMIRAAPEPERALDLWADLPLDERTPGAYAAVIRACARSGRLSYVHEAFRLARELLDARRDAYGRPAARPDRHTYVALLEGAKRIGDLSRVRWILAEMVRGEEVRVDEEVMMHVLHAYAAYKPPFRRGAVRRADGDEEAEAVGLQGPSSASSSTVSETARASADLQSISERRLPAATLTEEGPTFSHIPPQSRSEVIGEVKALFTRLREDAGASSIADYPSASPAHGTFAQVRLTPRLLNSYLSAFYAHAALEDAQQLFGTLFEEFGLQRNQRSYVEALERCALSRKGHERTVAREWSEELWNQWRKLEEKHGSRVGSDARMIERAHTAKIRILTLTGNVGQAIEQVRVFVHRYPPVHVREVLPKPAMRSTRTTLTALRPLVRMIPATDVPDDAVPPLLTFRDLEALHHRLVAGGQREAIGYVKYVCKAYEGALRMRRDRTLRAEPAEDSGSELV